MVQRATIVLACLLWMTIFSVSHLGVATYSQTWSQLKQASLSKTTLVAIIIGLSTVERVCAVGNQFVMERDWVPTLASESSEPPLHSLNAIMRRIDLISKLVNQYFGSSKGYS